MPEVITKHPDHLRMTRPSRRDLRGIRAEGPPPARGTLDAAFAGWGFGAMLPAAIAGAVLRRRRR